MDRHARRIGMGHFANDFCKSCRMRGQRIKTVLYILETCLALCQRRKMHLGAYCIDDRTLTLAVSVVALLEALSGLGYKIG